MRTDSRRPVSLETIRHQIDSEPRRRFLVDEEKRAIRTALQLAKLRRALGVSQEQLAEQLSVSQANVSRVERQEDLYISTLRNYVGALGARLEIRAVFDDGQVVQIEFPEPMVRPIVTAPTTAPAR
ncbi:MAG: helix-turn-helix domain-containing protein [Chloroflexi bacterium]|nr:MAG: helix-turn-helix domain-containing protein [Chloroflexota bacterium]